MSCLAARTQVCWMLGALIDALLKLNLSGMINVKELCAEESQLIISFDHRTARPSRDGLPAAATANHSRRLTRYFIVIVLNPEIGTIAVFVCLYTTANHTAKYVITKLLVGKKIRSYVIYVCYKLSPKLSRSYCHMVSRVRWPVTFMPQVYFSLHVTYQEP